MERKWRERKWRGKYKENIKKRKEKNIKKRKKKCSFIFFFDLTFFSKKKLLYRNPPIKFLNIWDFTYWNELAVIKN
jgi:hypothetical protein